jgi:hypothetical protein
MAGGNGTHRHFVVKRENTNRLGQSLEPRNQSAESRLTVAIGILKNVGITTAFPDVFSKARGTNSGDKRIAHTAEGKVLEARLRQVGKGHVRNAFVIDKHSSMLLGATVGRRFDANGALVMQPIAESDATVESNGTVEMRAM